jgi:hypothetical protein
LEELPFLLKGFLQAGMRSLRVSPDYLGKFEHVISPRWGFLLDLFALLGLVADELSKAATSSHDFPV